MDINNVDQRNRLFKAIESSYRAAEPFRRLTRDLVSEYAGSSYGFAAYGNNGPKYQTMTNLFKQMVDAYQMSLVANRPRIMISTKRKELKFFAKIFEKAGNDLIKEIRLEETLRQWVMDGLFGMGVVKTHLASAGLLKLDEDTWVDPGKPFASNVALDNFVFDMGSTKWSQVRFVGDAYRISLEDLKDATIYDQEAVGTVSASSKFGMDNERMERLSKGWEVDQDDLEPMVDLIDVWIRRDKMIYTFVLDRNARLFTPGGKPIAQMSWDGPEDGPYHILGFNDVPENIMPTSMAADLAELNRLINSIMRKQSKRARSQKKIITYTPAGADSATRLQRAGDDSFVEVQDPKEIGKVELGGVDAANAQFMTQVMEIYDRLAGNLTALLGLGAQTDTATQEQLIYGSVNKKVASMQYRVVDATVKLVRGLGHMLWHDSYHAMQVEIPIDDALGLSYDVQWTPDERLGHILDYEFDIDEFSMPYQSPSQKANALSQLVTQIFMPGMQLMMQQGGTIDFAELAEQFSDLYNMPRLLDVIKFTTPPSQQQEGPQQPDGPSMPGNTTRTYNRVSSSSGGSPQARSQATQQAWAGVANQQQQSMLAKPGG